VWQAFVTMSVIMGLTEGTFSDFVLLSYVIKV